MAEIEVYGNCPVQGSGVVDGHAWYFRARHEGWRFAVSDTDDEDDAVVVGWSKDVGGLSGWRIERPWMVGDEFAAGWMPDRHALKLISICLRWWREGRLERAEAS